MQKLREDIYFLLGFSVLAFFGWVMFKFMTATGSVEFCYINQQRGCCDEAASSTFSYVVMGYRQWAGDVSLGHYNTNAEAVEAVNKLQCLAKHK